MWEVFGEAMCINRRFCFSRHIGGRKALFVNTATDYLPQDQVAFLIEEGSDEPSVLFIHHPPDLISHGFMSVRQPLHNFDEVADAIRQTQISDVFCGHYHNEIDKDCDGFTLHLTPSPAFQIDLNKVDFTFQDFVPKVRVIDIDQGNVATRLEAV
jgi:Icc protein